MINWKDSLKELPKDGEFVACLDYHWKECWPLSAEIIFGEVESYTNPDGVRIARVNTMDFTGKGSYTWSFPIEGNFNDERIVCWAYATDFKRPEFVKHDPHWGDEK